MQDNITTSPKIRHILCIRSVKPTRCSLWWIQAHFKFLLVWVFFKTKSEMTFFLSPDTEVTHWFISYFSMFIFYCSFWWASVCMVVQGITLKINAFWSFSYIWDSVNSDNKEAVALHLMNNEIRAGRCVCEALPDTVEPSLASWSHGR